MSRHWNTPVRNFIAVNEFAGVRDFPVFDYPAESLLKKFDPQPPRRVSVTDTAIEEVLRNLGKTKPEHELNCGCCGYDTCREKARAVLEGKATLTMCLPYLKERAESFSDDIIKNTPNAIVVVNENFEVQQINNAACALLNVSSHDILGDQVVRVLDPIPFIEAGQRQANSYNKRVYLPEYKRHVDQTLIYNKGNHIIICIMRDVTGEEARKAEKEEFDRKTIEIADKVVEKQESPAIWELMYFGHIPQKK
jgi:PAS domain-containing protein